MVATIRLVPGAVVCAALIGQLTGQQQADIRVDVGLVTVACSVIDRGGAPVKNLRSGDFILRDNGKEQLVEHFWQESDLPLMFGLIVDVSGSQSAFVESPDGGAVFVTGDEPARPCLPGHRRRRREAGDRSDRFRR